MSSWPPVQVEPTRDFQTPQGTLERRLASFPGDADAQKRPCRIEARPLAEATEWLQEYRKLWEANFERLDTLLDELKARKNKP